MKPYKVKHQGCKNPLSIITKLLFFKIRASHLTLFIYIYIYYSRYGVYSDQLSPKSQTGASCETVILYCQMNN